MRIIEDAQTPTGEAGFLIECTCGSPHGTGRAIVRDSGQTREILTAEPERVHGFVTLAHHPALSRAPQIRRNGPWAA